MIQFLHMGMEALSMFQQHICLWVEIWHWIKILLAFAFADILIISVWYLSVLSYQHQSSYVFQLLRLFTKRQINDQCHGKSQILDTSALVTCKSYINSAFNPSPKQLLKQSMIELREGCYLVAKWLWKTLNHVFGFAF